MIGLKGSSNNHNHFSMDSTKSQTDSIHKSQTVGPPGAVSPGMIGPNSPCGNALATEIDTYRRRIQTLLHFFDCIAQHWWDQLYAYKETLIRRPSKSADDIRSYRSRLLRRLNKFTMRIVVPATTAIGTMEAHASVKILPLNFFNQLPSEFGPSEILPSMETADGLLRKACNLARRLGDIEKLKQRLILSALTWITSDGRDFTLRAQRVAMLVRHAEPCLIEHFDGVRALITHYYRPRIISGPDSSSPKSEPITAARLTTTNEQIVQAVRSVCARSHQNFAITPAVGFEPDSDRLSPSSRLGFWTESKSRSPDQDDTPTPGAQSNLFSYDTGELQGKAPILPSVVLNPLSVDSSLLDWLSYEVNQRDFNLHVLNMEEPEEFVYHEETGSVYLNARQPSISNEKLSPASSQDLEISSLERKFALLPSMRGDFKFRPSAHQPMLTPIASPELKEPHWSDASNESDASDFGEEKHQVSQSGEVKAKGKMNENISEELKSTEQISLPEQKTVQSSMVESFHEPANSSDLNTESFPIRSQNLVSAGGEGAEGITHLLSSEYLVADHHAKYQKNTLVNKTWRNSTYGGKASNTKNTNKIPKLPAADNTTDENRGKIKTKRIVRMR